MTGGWRDLRETDRDLAFCLLFAPASRRDMLADRLLLAHEAESAIRVTSELMLAAIRLQWWDDALETGRHENVPLTMRLLGHMDSGRIAVEDLKAQLALWQDRLQEDTYGVSACWQDFFQQFAAGDDTREPAGAVGRAFGDADQVSGILDRHLASLDTGQFRWIGMLGLLLRHRCSVPAGDADPMLVWRMLGWRYGVRRPPAPPTTG